MSGLLHADDAWRVGADTRCPQCERDSCDGTCAAAATRALAAVEPLRFRRASELIGEARSAAIVDGLAWPGCVTVVVAESGAGKTFLLLGVAAVVSDGQQWHGRATQRGSVAYVSFEGDALGLRLQALRDAGHSLNDVYVLRAFDPLSPRVARDGVESASPGEETLAEALEAHSARLAAEGRPPIVLLIVDTIRASLSGSEDKSDDVAAYLRAVRRLLAPLPMAAAILAHHSGWMDGDNKRRRERGSSAFRGNVDCTLYLEVIEDDLENHSSYLKLSALKVRDGARPQPLGLIRRQVPVNSSDRGDVTSSCIIERDDPGKQRERAAQAQARKTAAAEAEQRALDLKVLGRPTAQADEHPNDPGPLRR